MSTLNQEITRLETAKSNIDDVLIARGVIIPDNATLDTYHTLINSIKGGTSSEEVTATKSDVLAGTRTITSDSNDEIVEGTMMDKSGTTQSATATLDSANSRVQLAVPTTGKYDTNAKLYTSYDSLASLLGVESSKMLNTETILGVQGSIGSKAAATYYATTSDQTIAAGQYLSGAQTIKKLTQTNLSAGNIKNGVTVTVNNGNANVYSVAGTFTSDATATASQILSGKIAYVKGSKITGTMAITSAISFSAAARSSSSIRITWTNPSKGPWSGVKIRYSTSGYPGVSGGTLTYTGTGSSTTAGGTSYVDITGLSASTTYYFTCYSYATGLGDSSTGYNCSAKTSELVLWNGSLQNGAKYQDSDNTLLQYSYSSGAMSGKTIVIKLKDSYTSRQSVILYISSFQHSTLVNKVNKLYNDSWNAGQEYSYSLDNLEGFSDYTMLGVYFRYSDGDETVFPTIADTFSYIAIR